MIKLYILLFINLILSSIAFSQRRIEVKSQTAEKNSLFASNSILGFLIGDEDDSDPDKKQQIITFKTLTAKNYGDADFDPGAYSTSGLKITYLSSDSDVAVIENGKVRIIGVGTTIITARQSGDIMYSAAKEVKQTLQVFYPRGLDDIGSTEYKVYPNPSNGPVVIKMEKYVGWWEVKIFEYGGRTVYYNPCAKTDQLVLDFSGKPKGLYFVKIICGNSMKIEKLILQ